MASTPAPVEYRGEFADYRLVFAKWQVYNGCTRIIALWTLRTFWEQHPDARQALQAWYHDARKASWASPADVKREHRNASVVGNDRVVFSIKGNEYRLVVAIRYEYGIVVIRFVGTHREYDQIDVTVV